MMEHQWLVFVGERRDPLQCTQGSRTRSGESIFWAALHLAPSGPGSVGPLLRDRRVLTVKSGVLFVRQQDYWAYLEKLWLDRAYNACCRRLLYVIPIPLELHIFTLVLSRFVPERMCITICQEYKTGIFQWSS